MTKETEIALAQAVVEVMSTNMQGWGRVMQALAQRIDEITENMVAAPADRLQELQGQAREARALFKALSDAPKLVAGLKEKQGGKTSR